MLLGYIVEGGEIGGQGGVRERTKPAKGLGKGLGYWGALRAVWEFLARTDFTTTPVYIGAGESIINKADFCKAYKHVLVDPTGSVNVFAGWEEGEIELLRHYARETLAMLEDHSVDRFAETFLRHLDPRAGAFDEIVS
jgi:U3 small nucleolar RNA-associated protein 22